MLLEQRVTVVTGGGRGIERATAVKLTEESASVVIATRTTPELQEPEETAEVILFLASGKSSGVHGQSINVNAGMWMN
jgi:NAD(P)-dependent dehydrogenase (short-subunit alcohol dehydrogenase family)